jgi:glycosyltransferase involved in cell wall biosynthesis
VGRLDYHKGFGDLVEAAKILESRGSDFTIIHAGIREDWYDSRERDFGLKCTRIRSIGKISDSMLVSAYKESDVTVIPSHYETFGLSAIESLLLGTPVASTRTGIMPEIITDEEQGYLFDVGDVEGMANAIEKALKTRRDIHAKKALIPEVEYGRMESEAEKIMDLYNELVKSHQ